MELRHDNIVSAWSECDLDYAHIFLSESLSLLSWLIARMFLFDLILIFLMTYLGLFIWDFRLGVVSMRIKQTPYISI